VSTATARAPDGTAIWFEVFGNPAGEPLLMIQGLGADSRAWAFQRRALGRHYRCIALDNRGAGRSGVPPGPYDLEAMAGDAVAVLDASGHHEAHVMGASMGGVLAQLIAIRHPDRVRSLVLAATSCSHHDWRRDLLAGWSATATSRGIGALAKESLPWLFTPRFSRLVARPALAIFGRWLVGAPTAGFTAQVEAILAQSDEVRFELRSVTVPALVIVGSLDTLTPPEDAREVASMLSASRLEVLSGAAHALQIEQPGHYNRAVLNFLQSVTAQRSR